MERMEAYRQAVTALGDAPADTVARYIEENYGFVIPSNFIPVYRESLKELEKLKWQRKASKASATTSANA